MFQIDWQSGIPAYEQIVKAVVKLKAIGALKSGDKLPSVRQTATELGINPNTVQKAYLLLEQRGFIYSISGKGSFLTENEQSTSATLKMAEDELLKCAVSVAGMGLSLETAVETVKAAYKKGGITL